METLETEAVQSKEVTDIDEDEHPQKSLKEMTAPIDAFRVILGSEKTRLSCYKSNNKLYM